MNKTTTILQSLPLVITKCLAVLAILLIMLAPVPIAYAAENSPSYTTTDVPGLLISVGTHRLHIYCQGKGDLTIVVDTGLGAISLEWSNIQKAVMQTTRICLYDRAGYGYSESGPLPRTSSYIVDELYQLLKQADIRGPYILVGHSFGGYNMQLFASRYPQLSAGVVLVDSSHRDQYARFNAPPINIKTAPSENLGRLSMLSIAMPSLHQNIPVDVRDDILAIMLKQQMRHAMAYEYYNFRKSANEVKEGGEFPDIPLIVLTRGKRVYPENKKGDLMEQLWMQLQTELAELSQYSAHIIANKGQHFIHLDQPQLVIDSISLMIDIIKYCPIQSNLAQDKALAPKATLYDFTDATWRSNQLYTNPMQPVKDFITRN